MLIFLRTEDKILLMRMGSYIERLLLALAFAILLHLFVIQIIIEGLRKNAEYKNSIVEVEYIAPFTANKFDNDNREDIDSLQKDKKKAESREKERDRVEDKEEEIVKEEKIEKGQVVYLGETESNKAPEKYNYLAEHNSVVEKETRSRYSRDDYKNPAPRPQIGESVVKSLGVKVGEKKRPSPDIIIKNEKSSEGDNDKERDSGRLALKVPKLLKSDEIELEESDSGVSKNSKHSEEINGKDDEFQFGTSLSKGEELHKKRLAQLFPEDIFSGKYSGGPFNDWLKDVDESDATFLNAREYKFASFFNRIKKTVSQYWRPSDVILKYDPYGNIYGTKDRLTIVKVKIDSSGSLKEIDVSQSSGVEFLDKVAMDAFKSAQPFPNPPKGLMDKNGEITFNFGFYIEFSKSSLRLFKYE